MKKRALSVICTILLVLTLTGCCVSHTWEEAGCVIPKHCTECGQVKGEALGHSWSDATCESAMICSYCGEVKGEALGHDWKDATFSEAKTCNRCGGTEGLSNEESITKTAEKFLQAMTDTDIEALNTSCLGFVLMDLGMDYLKWENYERDFYLLTGLDKELLNEETQTAVQDYFKEASKMIVAGYSVKEITESDEGGTVRATIDIISENADSPLQTGTFEEDIFRMMYRYAEENYDFLQDIYLEYGEEAYMIQLYNDMIPELLEYVRIILSEYETKSQEIAFKVVNLNGQWFVMEATMVEEDESQNITL